MTGELDYSSTVSVCVFSTLTPLLCVSPLVVVVCSSLLLGVKRLHLVEDGGFYSSTCSQALPLKSFSSFSPPAGVGTL